MTDAPKKQCPKGHDVGTAFGRNRCGVRRCGEETAAVIGQSRIDLDELAKVSPEDAAFEQRSHLARLPRGLEGEAATEWAQKKLADLVPEAVASLAYDLRYGSDKVRSEAADKVLRANGLDKREAAGTGGQGLIVLNLGSSVSEIPWLQRMKPAKADE